MTDKEKLKGVFIEIGVDFKEESNGLLVMDEDYGDSVVFLFNDEGKYIST